MVTKHQQLQLWIELHVPLFEAVTAVVYCTLKEKRNITQRVTTRSVLTENTAMIFQLESHEVPERFRNKDFLVQVALQVADREGSVVPSDLEKANTISKEVILTFMVPLVSHSKTLTSSLNSSSTTIVDHDMLWISLGHLACMRLQNADA